MKWFDASEAAKIGAELADQFAPQHATRASTQSNQSASSKRADDLHMILERADREVRKLRLNFYKKAKFANSFKWRLIENGIAREVADEVTQSLVLQLSENQAGSVQGHESFAAPTRRPDPAKVRELFNRGNKCFARGNYAEAISLYEE